MNAPRVITNRKRKFAALTSAVAVMALVLTVNSPIASAATSCKVYTDDLNYLSTAYGDNPSDWLWTSKIFTVPSNSPCRDLNLAVTNISSGTVLSLQVRSMSGPTNGSLYFTDVPGTGRYVIPWHNIANGTKFRVEANHGDYPGGYSYIVKVML